MATLSNTGTMEQYVTRCGRAWDAFQNSGIRKMRKRLIEAVNWALTSSGVPAVEMGEDPTSADDGLFQFNDWSIVFGGASATTGESSNIFTNSVNTVYHEARHCEQWFRIAQGLASGKIRLPLVLKRGTVRPAKDDADSIADFMGIELRIANEAVNNQNCPLDERLVQGWFDSIYGANRYPRNVRLGDIDNREQDYLNLAEERDAWRWGDAAEAKAQVDYHLSYPNLYDWRVYTGRKWHFRSGKFFGGEDTLKAVDAAILAYENNPDQTHRDALKATFNSWYAANPKERAKRNVIPPRKRKGCVTELYDWCNQERGENMRGRQVMFF